jgi:hypothetical protein
MRLLHTAHYGGSCGWRGPDQTTHHSLNIDMISKSSVRARQTTPRIAGKSKARHPRVRLPSGVKDPKGNKQTEATKGASRTLAHQASPCIESETEVRWVASVRERGHVLVDEVLEALPHLGADAEKLGRFLQTLEESGVKVSDDPPDSLPDSRPSLSADDVPGEGLPEAMAGYLGRIGRVPLLGKEGERKVAKKLEEAGLPSGARPAQSSRA